MSIPHTASSWANEDLWLKYFSVNVYVIMLHWCLLKFLIILMNLPGCGNKQILILVLILCLRTNCNSIKWFIYNMQRKNNQSELFSLIYIHTRIIWWMHSFSNIKMTYLSHRRMAGIDTYGGLSRSQVSALLLCLHKSMSYRRLHWHPSRGDVACSRCPFPSFIDSRSSTCLSYNLGNMYMYLYIQLHALVAHMRSAVHWLHIWHIMLPDWFRREAVQSLEKEGAPYPSLLE